MRYRRLSCQFVGSEVRDVTGPVAVLASLFLVLSHTLLGAPPPETTGAVDYQRDIEPIFAAHCSMCHGPARQESGLRLDRRANLLKGGNHGRPSIVPGNSSGSFLFRLVAGREADLKMPLQGDPLSADQIRMLQTWIDQGAEMREAADTDIETAATNHWSLQPLRPVSPPPDIEDPFVEDPFVRNPIDAFVLAKLRQKGLSPSPPAKPSVLARRIHLVMLGLPPTASELKRWQASSDHRELVESVLSSPRYGERWAQHWLDVIRWAETWGFETNAPRPNAWQYRDWVIESLNADKPYDQFIFEQIAGDQAGTDAATGFLVAGPANLPGQIGKDIESMRQARQDELDEVVKTVSAAFLGLTAGCARCHDHKFDPISQKDYYSLQAVFAGLRYGNRRLRGSENDQWASQVPATKGKLDRLLGRLEEKRDQFKLLPPVEPDYHEERFKPVKAKSVRMKIAATHDGSVPSLYEFEIWTPLVRQGSSALEESKSGADPTTLNVALKTNGGRASGSSFAFANQTRHYDNLIDGRLQDDDRFPWVAKEVGPAWIGIELAKPTRIDRVVWQRGFGDGSGGFPVEFRIEVEEVDGTWTTVAESGNRMLHLDDHRAADQITLSGVSPEDTAAIATLLAKARDTQERYERLSAGPQVFAGRFSAAETTYLLHRGDSMRRRAVVEPNVPAVLGSLQLSQDVREAQRRTALAHHFASADNPLAARVIVNRIWQHYFGTGIVDTPSDFGRMGSQPTHPRLLDWLGVELIQSRWSLKHIHRLILESNTFRQSSAPRQQALSVDTDSRLLWRFPPRRLEAEALRDSMLFLSGKLNLQMYGPGFDFFNQKGGLRDYIPKQSFEAAGWRRMVYATKIRMQAVDVFGAFDCPDAGQMTAKRTRSITPIQALNMLNSTFVNRQAEFFAARLREEAGEKAEEQVKLAVQLAFSRDAADREVQRLAELCEQHGLAQVCRALINANEFVFLQ